MDMLVQSLLSLTCTQPETQAVDCHTQNHINPTPQTAAKQYKRSYCHCQKVLATCLCIWVHHIVELTCLSYVQNLLHLVVHFPLQHCSRLGHLHLSGGHWHDADDPSHPLQVHGQQPPLQLVPHWQSAPHPQSAVVSEGEKKSMIVQYKLISYRCCSVGGWEEKYDRAVQTYFLSML